MLGKLVSAVLGLLLLAVPQAHAEAQIVNINAAVSGCTSPTHACDYGAEHMPPGSVFRLIAPVNVALPAGTYRISEAGAAGRYHGWRFNRDPNWVWNFGIATNMGRQLEQQYQDAQRQHAHAALEQFRQDQQGWRRSFFDLPTVRDYQSQGRAPQDMASPNASASARKVAGSRRLDLVA